MNASFSNHTEYLDRPRFEAIFPKKSRPRPTLSVYKERMHGWVKMPQGVEHIF